MPTSVSDFPEALKAGRKRKIKNKIRKIRATRRKWGTGRKMNEGGDSWLRNGRI